MNEHLISVVRNYIYIYLLLPVGLQVFLNRFFFTINYYNLIKCE